MGIVVILVLVFIFLWFPDKTNENHSGYFQNHIENGTEDDIDMESMKRVPYFVILILMSPDVTDTKNPDEVYNGAETIQHQNDQWIGCIVFRNPKVVTQEGESKVIVGPDQTCHHTNPGYC